MTLTTLHLSDAHLIHQWDSVAEEMQKRRALECVAQCVRQVQGAVGVVLNGDMKHRPDDPQREGFRLEAAQHAMEPLIDVLAEKNASVVYIPGNCDPWAGMDGECRDQLRKIVDPQGRLTHLEFTDGFFETENTLVTHGHVFEPSVSTILREAFPAFSRVIDHQRMGLKLLDLLTDPVATLKARNEREWSGSHRKAYLINKAVDTVMWAMPSRLKQHMDTWKQTALDRCYTKAMCYGASELNRHPDVIVMGHTHNAMLLCREELRALLGEDIILPQAFLNTGTVTGDRGKPATFGIQTAESVKLMHIGSPSSVPAYELRRVPLELS